MTHTTVSTTTIVVDDSFALTVRPVFQKDIFAGFPYSSEHIK